MHLNNTPSRSLHSTRSFCTSWYTGRGTEARITALMLHEAPLEDWNDNTTNHAEKCIIIQVETEPTVDVVRSLCSVLTKNRSDDRAGTGDNSCTRHIRNQLKLPILNNDDEVYEQIRCIPISRHVWLRVQVYQRESWNLIKTTDWNRQRRLWPYTTKKQKIGRWISSCILRWRTKRPNQKRMIGKRSQDRHQILCDSTQDQWHKILVQIHVQCTFEA